MSLEQSENLTKMEQEALKRKERLNALKRKITTTEYGTEKTDSKPVFRSYKPTDESIATTEETKLGDIEDEVSTQLELMKTPIVVEEIDIVNLAPRKPDWDLKRDVAKKLDKLEKRTQKAIAELIRDRLKLDQENILQAVGFDIATESTNKMVEE